MLVGARYGNTACIDVAPARLLLLAWSVVYKYLSARSGPHTGAVPTSTECKQWMAAQLADVSNPPTPVLLDGIAQLSVPLSQCLPEGDASIRSV